MSWREFFYFQKSDRKVLVVAMCVAVVALGVIFLLGGRHDTTPGGESDSLAMNEGMENPPQDGAYYATEGRTINLSPFDPNTADSTQLLSLGLQPRQVRNIYRYRAKGGVFRQPEDFARVYGLTAGQYRELQPYIRISPDYRPASEVYGRNHSYGNGRGGAYGGQGGESGGGRKPFWSSARDGGAVQGNSVEGNHERGATGFVRDTVRYPVKLREGEVIDLNASDTTMLKKVPGIGSYYARKVVAYRERLGGFFSTDQLFEIEGFPEEAVDFLTCNGTVVKKLNVNQLSQSQLRKHPYIGFYQAKAITDYRRLKGPLHSFDDLRLLPDFSQEVIDRLSPYVEF